jgi:hypothetical protein
MENERPKGKTQERIELLETSFGMERRKVYGK